MSILAEQRPELSFQQRATSLRRRLPALSFEAKLLWLAVFLFIAAIFWWLTQDNRIPEWDSGLHMQDAFIYHVQLGTSGQRLWPFESYDTYPPLVALLGAGVTFIFGPHTMALTLVSDIVFTSLFAFACYGIGRRVAGNRAGLLAGIFGLGLPIIATMAHNFDLDPPEAALVACSVWALLASNRFRDQGLAALAGVLCGLAMLSKETAVVFFAGVILTMLIRGGWRNWLGITLFGILFATVAAPWYIYHANELYGTYKSIAQLYVNSAQSPPRWSLTNLEWYFWCLVNQQALFPLTLFAIVGTVVAVYRSVTRFTPDNVLPELLVGGLVGYLFMTYLTHKDPRYSMPLLVYVAVIGTFWIVDVRRKLVRRLLMALVVVVAAINLEAMQIGIGGTHRAMIALPGNQTTMIYPYQLTVYENQGWLRGPPQHEADVRAMLKGLKRMGITTIAIDQGVNDLDFSELGLTPVAVSLGFAVPQSSTMNPPGPAPHEAYLLTPPPRAGRPAPCLTLLDGTQVYVVGGDFSGINADLRDPAAPHKRYALICPGKSTVLWPPA